MITIQGAKGPRLVLDTTSVFDIGSCWVDGVDIAPGRAIPDDGDPRIDHSLEGFLFTCGPDHIRHPSVDGNGLRFPLHGSASGHGAQNVSVETDNGDLVARATVPLTLVGGHLAELQREWRIKAESGEVVLSDLLSNTGPAAFPCFLMYHMNIGSRHFDADTRLHGGMLAGGAIPWAFGSEEGGLFCVPAGEDAMAEVRLGPMLALGAKTLRVCFRTDTLPHLQVWHNQQLPARVLGIEPVSHRLADRQALELADEITMLQPGESRSFGLSFSFE